MSMYKQFTTDENLERNGVEVDYGDFIVTIARAGGANKKYNRVLAQKTRPYRRAIQTETMSDEQGTQIFMEIYAEACIRNWQAKVGEDAEGNPIYEKGIEPPEEGGALLPVTTENILSTFRQLPDLFEDIREQAAKISLYRATIQEADAGN